MKPAEMEAAFRSIAGGGDGGRPDIPSRFYSGAAWAACGKLLTFPLGLAVAGLLARLLAQDEMGVYFLALSVAATAATVAQLGLQGAVVRFVAEAMATGQPGRAGAAVRVAFRCAAATAAALGAALAVGGVEWLALRFFASPLLAELAPLIGLWIVALALQSLFAEAFRGFGDIRLATFFGELSTVLVSASVFAALYLVRGSVSLQEVVLLSFAACGIGVALAGFILYRKVASALADPGLRYREILSVSLPILIGIVGNILLSEAGIWIVGTIRGQESVAVYAAAARLVVLSGGFLSIVSAASQHMIPELRAQGKRAGLQGMLRATATIAGLPALGILAVLALAPATALGLVYGPDYREGAVILQILCLGQLLNIFTGQSGIVLTMTGHHSMATTFAVLSAAAVIASGIALTGTHGPAGMAVASAAGVALLNITTWLAARRLAGVWTHLGFDFRSWAK